MGRKSSTRVDEAPASYVVGPTSFANIVGCSREYARSQLRRWREEQEKGGPVRVQFVSSGKGPPTWCTTLGVLQAMGLARDHAMLRRISKLEEAVDFLSRRLDDEVARTRALEARLVRHNGPLR